MSRTNIEIGDDLIAAAQRIYRLQSKRSAVDLALRRLAGEALDITAVPIRGAVCQGGRVKRRP
jgi:Arc/MetJ family transcription regulator